MGKEATDGRGGEAEVCWKAGVGRAGRERASGVSVLGGAWEQTGRGRGRTVLGTGWGGKREPAGEAGGKGAGGLGGEGELQEGGKEGGSEEGGVRRGGGGLGSR